MNPVEIQAIYQQIASDPNLLQKGDEIIKQHLRVPDFALITLRILRDQQLPLITRKHIGYLFKSTFIGEWEQLTDQSNLQVQLLQNLLVSGENEINEIMIAIIVRLIQRGPIDFWRTSLSQLIQTYPSLEQRDLLTEFFIMLFRTEDSSLISFSQELLKNLLGVFTQTSSTEERRSILNLVYYIFKTVSFADQTDYDSLKGALDSTFQNWMHIIQTGLQSPSGQYLDIKVVGLNTLVLIQRDMQNYCTEKGLEFSQITLTLVNSYSQLYRQVCVHKLNFDQQQSIDFNSNNNLTTFLTEEEIEYTFDFDPTELPKQEQQLIAQGFYASLQLLQGINKSVINNVSCLQSLYTGVLMTPYEAQEFQKNPKLLTDQDDEDSNPRNLAFIILEGLFNSKKQSQQAYLNLRKVWEEDAYFQKTWQGVEAYFAIHEQYLDDLFPQYVRDFGPQILQIQGSIPTFTEIDLGRKLNYFSKGVQVKNKHFSDMIKDIFEKVYVYLKNASSVGVALVGLRNLAILSVYARNNSIVEIVNVLGQLQLPDIFTKLSNLIDQQSLHTLLDSSLQILKTNSNDQVLLEFSVASIIRWQEVYDNDTLICKIINDVIEFVSNLQSGWNYLHQASAKFSGALWLYSTRFLVKHANTAEQKQAIAVKLPELLTWLLNPKNFESDLTQQATVLLENFISQFHGDLQNTPLIPQITQVLQRLLTIHQNESEEVATEQVPSLLLSVWFYIFNQEIDITLVQMLSSKINHSNSPSFTEALWSVFAVLALKNPLILSALPQDILNNLLSKLIRFNTVYRAGVHINFISLLLIEVLKQFNLTDQYYDALLNCLTTPLNFNLISVLINFFELKGQKKVSIKDVVEIKDSDGGDNNDDGWEDEENDIDQDTGLNQIDSFLLKNFGQIEQIDYKTKIKEVLKEFYNKNPALLQQHMNWLLKQKQRALTEILK